MLVSCAADNHQGVATAMPSARAAAAMPWSKVTSVASKGRAIAMCSASALDETGLALGYAEKIRKFEAQRPTEEPWLGSITRQARLDANHRR